MKKYLVKVTEVLQRTIVVDAKNEDEAEKIIKQSYQNCDIVLDSNDFQGETTIECIGEVNKNDTYNSYIRPLSDFIGIN